MRGIWLRPRPDLTRRSPSSSSARPGGRRRAAASPPRPRSCERAVALTQDPARRAERALAAAQASLQAGAFDAALGLLATAEAEPLDDFQRARVDLLRAEIAFASSRGSAAPALLLARCEADRAVRRASSRAPAISKRCRAALFAARLAGPGGGLRDVAHAVQAAPSAASPPTAADLLLDGWAALFADGCAAATPTLREALSAVRRRHGRRGPAAPALAGHDHGARGLG